MKFIAKQLQQGLLFKKMSKKAILFQLLHFDRQLPRQRWSVPDVTRELTLFKTLSLTQDFSEFVKDMKHTFILTYRLTFSLLIYTIYNILCQLMTSLGAFKKRSSVPDVTVPDVTKIPPEIDAHIHAIMGRISKTSLNLQSFVFSL